ncbi:MAG: hypothetical protein LBM19_03880, partial [Holosporales bacterium]|nr:hypothetical protein [Holosporales bacterium]
MIIIARLVIAGALAAMSGVSWSAEDRAGREERPIRDERTLGIAGEETGWGTGEWAFGERRDVAEEAIEEMREAVRGA